MAKTFQDYMSVVDLETLAVGSDAVILSLGLTCARYDDTTQTFNTLVDNGLYLKFDIKDQLKQGRRTSKRVINWWYDQHTAARQVLNPSPDDVSLYDLGKYLKEFYDKFGIDIKQSDMYDRNCFDISKLQYLFEQELNQDVPWNYHNTFDIPTAFRFMGFDRYAGIRVSDIEGATYHHALHDAAVDHVRMNTVLHQVTEGTL